LKRYKCNQSSPRRSPDSTEEGKMEEEKEDLALVTDDKKEFFFCSVELKYHSSLM